MTLSYRFANALCLTLLTLLCACSTDSARIDSAQATPQALQFELRAGQLLSIIEPYNNTSAEAKAAMKIYYAKALPLAAQFGYQNHGALRVVETVVGREQPSVFVVASWPDEAADLSFESQPEWQQYKSMRPLIWDELRFYKAQAETAKTLRFRQDKHYTIAFAWHDVTAPNDYQTYLDGVMPAVETAGGRFIHTLRTPRFVSHATAQPGPSEINIVEWDTEDGLDLLQSSDLFTKHYNYLQSGTTRFDLYRIAPIIN
ncbi:MAG: hypothetical protein AAFO81_07815 [Pseudomonadota bacterium]